MDQNFSKQHLDLFLGIAEKQGFFNANTLGGMRAAFSRLLEDVDAAQDVRTVDVEAATIRYHNKHPGDLTPSTLRTYEARLKRLIDEFTRYHGDPANYKPYSRGLTKPAAERATSRTEKAAVVRGDDDVTTVDVVPVEATPQRTTPTAMAMSYPLRNDFVAQVLLPRNMTTDEARRLCAFIRTLATDFMPEI